MRYLGLLLPLVVFFSFQASGNEKGKMTFQKFCAPCHTVGGGRLVGPDLAGVTQKRSEEWLIKFIQKSQAMVQSGDEQAVAIFNEYNKMPMPDQPVSDDEVRAILEYIDGSDSSASATASAVAPSDTEATTPKATPKVTYSDDDVNYGRELFQGSRRFAKGGASCASCHDVAGKDVFGGGVLAVELTTAYSRLTDKGVRAVLSGLPFPLMKQAYQDKELLDEEVNALTAFLQHADEQRANQEEQNYGAQLFYPGLGGAVLLLGLYSLVWAGRKRESVNKEIYDRQIKSETDNDW